MMKKYIYRYVPILIVLELLYKANAQSNFTGINQSELQNIVTLPSNPTNRQDASTSILRRKDGLALYWGQGDYNEKRLSYYCDQEGVSIVILSFIANFSGGPKKSPVLDLSDNCKNTNNCSEAARDIKHCQKKGIKVLISLGGAVGPYKRQSWDPDLLAWWLWTKFLGGDDESVSRPFGDVVLDGVDYDPEGVDGEGYDRNIDTLRKLFKTQYPRREYLITAAPQCPDLEKYEKNAVYNILNPSNPKYNSYPNITFVQFYNNKCSASAYNSNKPTAFNFSAWNKWAQKTGSKIYLGVLGKQNNMDTGYVNYEKLTVILDDVERSKNFGGVMMWDASYAYNNPVPYLDGMQFGQAVARYLKQLATSGSSRLAAAFSGITSAFSEFRLPILVPIGGDDIGLLPFPCQGQPFLSLRSVTSESLAKSFGAPVDEITSHLTELGVSGDQYVNPGSYICITPHPGYNGSFVISYLYNSTINEEEST